jgi:hypothetical protein
MAWQLIYTSAPRLLEAGRTGFGTVARHRAVSGMLASTVERFSQFARLPGHDPRRVVHTYRVLTVAGASYHVFTRLRDAGSDYTGRTNHLAQHVIAEAREIRALAASGLTPADVLLAIPWRESWTEGPRFLDPSEEIDLSNFPPAASSAWAAITGNPACARLLGTPQALKGCYLILPPVARSLELFREAMIEAPQGGWQTSFTTSLEPNDEVGDFRWIGLPFDSPLRSQAEVSNRLLLDLTQPSKLPAPPEPPAKAPLPQPESAAPVTTHSPAEILSPKKVTLNRPPVSAAPASQMGGWSPEPARTSTKRKSKTMILAFAAISALVALTAAILLWQNIDSKNKRTKFEQDVNKVWGDHFVDGALRDTKNKIINSPGLVDGEKVLKSVEEYIKKVKANLAEPSKDDPKNPTETLPNDFGELQRAFNDWRDQEQKGPILSTGNTSELLGSYQKWRAEREAHWKALSKLVEPIGQLPEVCQLVGKNFAQTAKELLRKDKPEKSDLKEVERLAKDSEVTKWLEIWEGLDGDRKIQIANDGQNDRLLPEWLKIEARKVVEARDKALAETMEAERKAMQDKAAKTANTPKLKIIEDADSLGGTHPIFIFSSKDEANQKADKLPVEKDMLIYLGGLTDKNSIGEANQKPKAGELTKYKLVDSNDTKWKFAETMMGTDTLEIQAAGNISRLPNRFQYGGRIIARSKDAVKVLFDVRILVNGSSGSRPIWAAPEPVKPVTKDGAIHLQRLGTLVTRIRWVNATTEYKLRRNGPASEQKTFDLVCNKDECLVMPPRDPFQPRATTSAPTSDVEGLIRSKNQEITNLENEVKRKVKGSQDKLDTAKAELKELQDRQAKAVSQQQTPPPEPVRPPFSLPPGEYTVFSGAVEICTFKLPNGSEDNTTKSPKP